MTGSLLATEEEDGDGDDDKEASCEEHDYFTVGMLFCKWLRSSSKVSVKFRAYHGHICIMLMGAEPAAGFPRVRICIYMV